MRTIRWLISGVISLALLGGAAVFLIGGPRSSEGLVDGAYFTGLSPAGSRLQMRLQPLHGEMEAAWWEPEDGWGDRGVVVSGTVGAAGEVNLGLNEWEKDPDKFLRGRLGPTWLEVHWERPDGNGPVMRLERVAGCWVMTRRRGWRCGDSGLAAHMTAMLPAFEGSGFKHAVNERLRQGIGQTWDDFGGPEWADVLEVLWEDDMVSDWSYHVTCTIEAITDDMVSVRMSHDWFAGGAHGSEGERGANFVRDGDDARPLQLADLFRRDTDWAGELERLCAADLVRQKAIFVEAGEVKARAATRQFTVSRRGLTIYFEQGEVSSESAGCLRTRLKWDDVRRVLDPVSAVRFLWDRR